MVCKVFCKKLSEKGRKSGVKLTGMHFDATVLRNCHKNTQKGGPFWFAPGTLPLQTRRVKAAAFRPGFTPGKAPRRVAQQG